MTNGSRILIAAPERWDEACFAVPAVRALAASGLQVGVVCRDAQRDFWKTLETIEVLDFQMQPDVSAWEAALAWQYDPFAKAIRKAGVNRRIAPSCDRKLNKWATHLVEATTHVLNHRAHHYLATVEALGVATHHADFFLPASAPQVSAQDAVLICPDSDFGPSHEWPLERWVELAKWLATECERRIEVVDLAGGRGLGARLAAAMGNGASHLTVHSIADAMAHLRRHRIVLSADGSLPHVAAHLGATCLVMFGPNDAVWRRPIGKHHVIIKNHAECAPCLMAKCPMDHRCMQRLEVSAVMTAVRPLLKIAQK